MGSKVGSAIGDTELFGVGCRDGRLEDGDDVGVVLDGSPLGRSVLKDDGSNEGPVVGLPVGKYVKGNDGTVDGSVDGAIEVGFLVGFAFGDFVGFDVAIAEGLIVVGLAEGSLVGFTEDKLVGVFDGFKVGVSVGISDEGSDDGTRVEMLVGFILGTLVGFFDGEMVDFELGRAEVGAYVGLVEQNNEHTLLAGSQIASGLQQSLEEAQVVVEPATAQVLLVPGMVDANVY